MAGGLSGVVQGGKPYLQSGKLRHLIQIVEPTLAQDSMGGWSVNVNTVLLTTWASIEPLTAQEKFAAHEFANVVSHKIWLRNPRSAMPGDKKITPNMQIYFNQQQFQIVGVLKPTESGYGICLMCVEIDSSVNQVVTPAENTL